jgi:hypothetical protein
MTLDELDRVLEQALDVEPPAGYVARVRARVAAEESRPARHTWLPLAALAACVLVLVAGGLAIEYEDAFPTADGARTAASTDRTQGTARAAASPSAVPGHEAVSAPAPAWSRQTAAVHAGPGAVTGTGPRGGIAVDEPAGRSAEDLPLVLIAPQDSDGIRLLLAFTGQATGIAPTGGDGFQAPLQVTQISVAPIAVDALPELTPLAFGEFQ